MNGYVVYIDVLLLLNFSLDFLILWAAGRLLRRSISLVRLFFAALFGAVYGAALIVPFLQYLFYPPVAVAVSLIMLRIAYRVTRVKEMLSLTGVFYLIACSMAGAVLAAQQLLQTSRLDWTGLDTLRAGTLLAALPVALIMAKRGAAALRRTLRREDFHLTINLMVAGHECSLTALIDTGCTLREPLTGRPVIVADYRSVRSLLPECLRTAWEQGGGDAAQLLRAVEIRSAPDGWNKRLLVVPYSGIGQINGLLAAFRPDRVTFSRSGRTRVLPAVIALAPRGLGKGSPYQAIVNPEALEEIKEAGA